MSDSQIQEQQESIKTLNNNITSNPDSDHSLESSKSKSDQQSEQQTEELDKNPEKPETEDEEEEECGFCLFMKGGACKEEFIAWERCMDEAEKKKEDIVEKCFQVTQLLKKCMEANADYYGPVLSAEKSATEEVLKELETEKSSINTDDQNEVLVQQDS